MEDRLRCGMCGAPATIHFTKFIGGKMTSMHLCQKCAENFEKHKIPVIKFAEMIAKKLLKNGALKEKTGKNGVPAKKKSCPNCGWNERDFGMSELLGCPKCYEIFVPQLERYLPKIHGTSQHVVPENSLEPAKNSGKIAAAGTIKEENLSEEQLRELIKNSVANDDYATAALARDILKKRAKKPAARRTKKKANEDEQH